MLAAGVPPLPHTHPLHAFICISPPPPPPREGGPRRRAVRRVPGDDAGGGRADDACSADARIQRQPVWHADALCERPCGGLLRVWLPEDGGGADAGRGAGAAQPSHMGRHRHGVVEIPRVVVTWARLLGHAVAADAGRGAAAAQPPDVRRRQHGMSRGARTVV
eukprot:362856-Chlamydomonas_euryale.AAC.5